MRMWSQKQEKYVRMRSEGRMMWERGSSLNQRGTERMGDKETKSGILMFGRRKRFRLVKRLVQLRRSTMLGVGAAEAVVSAKERQEKERQQRGPLMAMAVRPSRRPWEKEVEERSCEGGGVLGVADGEEHSGDVAQGTEEAVPSGV